LAAAVRLIRGKGGCRFFDGGGGETDIGSCDAGNVFHRLRSGGPERLQFPDNRLIPSRISGIGQKHRFSFENGKHALT
jgi:hypothetical protein